MLKIKAIAVFFVLSVRNRFDREVKKPLRAAQPSDRVQWEHHKA